MALETGVFPPSTDTHDEAWKRREAQCRCGLVRIVVILIVEMFETIEWECRKLVVTSMDVAKMLLSKREETLKYPNMLVRRWST